MNPPKALLHTLFAMLKWALSVLALLVCSAALLSCKTAALPSTFRSSIILPPTQTEVAIMQMLATKAVLVKQANETELAPGSTLYPPSTRLSKPILIPAQSPVPPPTAFAPSPDGIPAGTGTLVNAKAMPAFYLHDFVDENIWYKDTEGGTLRTTVYSGFMLAPGGFPTAQGVVVVQVMKMDSHGDVKEVYYRLFPTPTQSGSVHITGAVGERLILQATDGTTFYFDVPLRQYVLSLTWTPTPGPISPVATPTLIPPTFPPVSAIHGEDVTPVGAGVVGQFMVSLNHGRYHIFNTWIENRDSNRQAVFVYAGELARLDGGETMQGAVVVQVWQSSIRNGLPDAQHLEDTEYLTPIQAGPVKIIDAVGERLVVQSITDGTKFYFDVPSRQFVPSMTAIVPTATIPASPLATPTPAR
jgi:hypothetical protein